MTVPGLSTLPNEAPWAAPGADHWAVGIQPHLTLWELLLRAVNGYGERAMAWRT